MEKFRNLCLLSHYGAGKTSLSEAILFDAGAITRLGKVDDGTTTSDYDPDEIKRKISLNLSLLPFHWRDIKVNLIDAPGYTDFAGEMKSAIRVSEGAVVLVCASSGVEVGTEQAWEYCKEAELPRLIFVSKMDRENADFFRTVQDIQSKFGIACQPVQIPIGAQSAFKGIVDLLRMKSYTGVKGEEAEVPSELKAQADSFHAKLVEAVAAADEKLIEKYLNDEAISQEELEAGLKQAVVTGKIVPILVGSGLQNTGIIPLMDAICNYLPSPAERDVIVLEDSKQKKIKPSAGGSLAALVFKTSADPYVGKLTYFRVYSGSISSNSSVWNANRSEAERIGQLYMMRGKNQEAVAKVEAGDIGVVAKLSLTSTGDTLCTRDKSVKIAPILFPEPMFSQAIFPKTKADLDKLGSVLTRLTEEDPTLRVRRDSDTGETVLSGLGETQLAVVMDKMTRKFGVGVELKMPKVPYKETIAYETKAEFKHKKQTGGHGQYGHVMLELEPLPRGSGLQFENKVIGGAIPRNYIPAVEKGVNEAAQEGVLAGYPVTDLKAIVYDGSFHPVDSSDICFKIAGAGALKKGMTQGQPVLLEPIVNLKVTVPESYTGDIMSDLNNKRGRVLGMTPQDGMSIIEAQVPQAEILRYAIDLKSITQGRGKYTYTFDHYEEVPAHLVQKVVAERQAEKAAEKAA